MIVSKDDRPVVTLADVFDEHFKDVPMDRGMADRIYRFQIAFLNRDAEHLAFFGSNLIGVHVIRWRIGTDTPKFFHDVCKVDFAALERDILKVTTIVHEFKISSDLVNLTLMYLIHRLLTSPSLNQSQRERGAYDTALIFFYRCIAIRQSDYFHFPADPKLAAAAAAALTRKFLIKQLGSWRAVMEYRAKDLTNKEGLHYKALVAFTNDDLIAYAISDSENRIRELYKAYYAVFEQTRASGSRIGASSSTVVDVEGVEKLKEKVRSVEQYINYTRQAIVDKHSFVKPELIKVITDINTNTSQRILTATLTWLSDNYNNPKWHKEIDDWLSTIIVHSFHLLENLKESETRDYPTLLVNLKNLYLSTRSVDQELSKIRKQGDKLIKAANGRVNTSLAMATRTSTILYVTLRALISSVK